MSNIIAEISTHKVVKEKGGFKLYQKGFEIEDLKYEDEFLYVIAHEDDIFSVMELLKENNRINAAEFLVEYKTIAA